MSSDRLLNAYVKFNRTNPKRYTEPLSLSHTHALTHARTHTHMYIIKINSSSNCVCCL